MEAEQTVAPKDTSLAYADVINAYRGLGKTSMARRAYFTYWDAYIAPTLTMDEFETRIMQERIKTCRGRLSADEYFKYCKEINNTYTDYAIKNSTLCYVLYKKRPTSYTNSPSTQQFEKHVRKKPQWTHLNSK